MSSLVLAVAALLFPFQDAAFEQLVRQLAHDDVQKRQEAEDRIAALGRPALEKLEAVARDHADAEVRERARNAARRIWSRIALVQMADGWYRSTDPFVIAYHRMETSEAVYQGAPAYRLKDTIVRRRTFPGEIAKYGNLQETVFEAHTRRDDTLSLLHVRWTEISHDVPSAGKMVLEVEATVKESALLLKVARFTTEKEVFDPKQLRMREEMLGLFNREIPCEGTVTWIHALPRLAALRPADEPLPPGLRKIVLPEDRPVKGVSSRWEPEEKLRIGNAEVAARVLNLSPSSKPADRVWIDGTRRIVQIDHYGGMPACRLTDEADARKGVDRE